MNAYQVGEQFEGGTYAVARFMSDAFRQGLENVRVARARDQAADAHGAAQIRSAALQAHAQVSRTTARQLADKHADCELLQDRVDLLEIERSQLLAHCASMLAEIDMLRTRR
jgi:hypothetical protein